MAYLKDLFSWSGEWTRFKFWVYPLPVLVVYLILSTFVAFSSLQWHTNDAKEAFIRSSESNIQKMTEMSELSFSSDYNDDISQMQAEVDAMKADIAANPSTEPNNSLISILTMALWVFGILYIYISIASYVKRLRDLWKSPWMVLLMFVPIANLYLWIICGFFKG